MVYLYFCELAEVCFLKTSIAYLLWQKVFFSITHSRMTWLIPFFSRKTRAVFYFTCLLKDFYHINITNESLLAGQSESSIAVPFIPPCMFWKMKWSGRQVKNVLNSKTVVEILNRWLSSWSNTSMLHLASVTFLPFDLGKHPTALPFSLAFLAFSHR